MTTALSIDNSEQFEACPLCDCKDLYLVGTISYSEPLIFATTPITLSHKPSYHRCQQCGSGIVQQTIPEETMRTLYQETEGNRWSAPPFTQEKTLSLRRAFDRLLKTGTRLLDIGCSSGELLDYAVDRGAVVAGVEPSTYCRQECETKGHHVYRSIDDIPDDVTFDSITAFDLIEHLHEPKHFLQKCSSLLRPNGSLLILTGNPNCLSARLANQRWWYIGYPEHVFFPTKKSLQHLADFTLDFYNPVYNSQAYQTRSCSQWNIQGARNVKDTAIRLRKQNYTVLPLLGPDHALVHLMKRI